MPRARKEKKRASGSRQPEVENPPVASADDVCADVAPSEAPCRGPEERTGPAFTAETTPSIHPCPDPAPPDDWSLPGEFTPRSVATEAGWLELIQDTVTGKQPALSALDLDEDPPKGAAPPSLRKVRKDELYGDSWAKVFVGKEFAEKERKPLKERAEEKRQRKAEKREKRLLRYGGEP